MITILILNKISSFIATFRSSPQSTKEVNSNNTNRSGRNINIKETYAVLTNDFAPFISLTAKDFVNSFLNPLLIPISKTWSYATVEFKVSQIPYNWGDT